MQTTKVVLLGGGYTGVWAYRALTRWLGRKVQITLVDKNSYHSFHGFINEVLAGNLASRLTASPFDECMPKANHVKGLAERVDTTTNTVHVVTDAGPQVLHYDHLIVATGAEEHTQKIPGLTDHAWRMRTPQAPQKLIEHLIANVKNNTTDQITGATTVVLIGAGFTGTESAAALKRRFGDRLRVVLVTAGPTTIADWKNIKFLQKHLDRNLEKSGVEIIRNARVTNIDATTVTLNNGTQIAAETVIATLGNKGCHISGLENQIDPDTGLLKVNRALQVTNNIWAGGDIAAVRNQNGYVAKDALWAIVAGTRIGRNISRVQRGRKPAPFNFRGLGSVATFAPGSSVGKLLGVPLNGYITYLIRQVLFLWFVPSRTNAIRVMKSFHVNRHANTARTRLEPYGLTLD